jgi:hypothetical protein
VVLIGETEVQAGSVIIKDLATGTPLGSYFVFISHDLTRGFVRHRNATVRSSQPNGARASRSGCLPTLVNLSCTPSLQPLEGMVRGPAAGVVMVQQAARPAVAQPACVAELAWMVATGARSVTPLIAQHATARTQARLNTHVCAVCVVIQQIQILPPE